MCLAFRDSEEALPAPRQSIPTGPQVHAQPKPAGEDPNKGYGSPEAAAAADRLLQLGVTVNPPGKSGAVDWGALAGTLSRLHDVIHCHRSNIHAVRLAGEVFHCKGMCQIAFLYPCLRVTYSLVSQVV